MSPLSSTYSKSHSNGNSLGCPRLEHAAAPGLASRFPTGDKHHHNNIRRGGAVVNLRQLRTRACRAGTPAPFIGRVPTAQQPPRAPRPQSRPRRPKQPVSVVQTQSGLSGSRRAARSRLRRSARDSGGRSTSPPLPATVRAGARTSLRHVSPSRAVMIWRQCRQRPTCAVAGARGRPGRSGIPRNSN